MCSCFSFPACLKTEQHVCWFGIIMRYRSGRCFRDGHPGAASGPVFWLQVDDGCLVWASLRTGALDSSIRQFQLLFQQQWTFILCHIVRISLLHTPSHAPELALMLMICFKAVWLLWRLATAALSEGCGMLKESHYLILCRRSAFPSSPQQKVHTSFGGVLFLEIARDMNTGFKLMTNDGTFLS